MENTLLSGAPMASMSARGRLASPKRLVSLVAALLIVASAVYFLMVAPNGKAFGLGSGSKSYRAVFLDNNQVYFGKLDKVGGQWLKLTDVYYLQENTPPSTPPPKGQTSPRFTLLKLGRQELHGPTDMMVFNREHVLFWENLKSDSEVVKKIFEDKEQQAKEQEKK